VRQKSAVKDWELPVQERQPVAGQAEVVAADEVLPRLASGTWGQSWRVFRIQMIFRWCKNVLAYYVVVGTAIQVIELAPGKKIDA
jgi:hypothetical protein